MFYALGGFAGMFTAAMLGDWVLPFVYNVGFLGFKSSVFGWLFLGGLIALKIFLRRQYMNRQNVALSGIAMIFIVLNHSIHLGNEYAATLGYLNKKI